MTSLRHRRAATRWSIMVCRYVAYSLLLTFGSFVLVWDNTPNATILKQHIDTTPVARISPCKNECADASVDQQAGCWDQCNIIPRRPPAKNWSHYFRFHDEPRGQLPSYYSMPHHDIYFSSAFLDERLGVRMVRTLGMRHVDADVTLICRFNSSGTSLASAQLIHQSWPPNSKFLAVVYSCAPPDKAVPTHHVSLCVEYTNNCTTLPLDVVPDNRGRHGLGLCIKAASGALQPERLVEWIELNRILGVDHFLLYNSSVEGRARQVLDFYQSRGILENIPFPLMPKLYDYAKHKFPFNKADDYSLPQQAMLVSLNDCLYRFNNRFEFLMLIDLDEVLVPGILETLPFLAQRIFRNKTMLGTSGVLFPTAWHFSDFGRMPLALPQGQFPSSFKVSRYTRCTPPTDNQPKSIVRTNSSLILNWHGVVRSLPGGATKDNVWVGELQMTAVTHHYRGKCVDKFLRKDCHKMLQMYLNDSSIQPYATMLHARTTQVLQILELDLN